MRCLSAQAVAQAAILVDDERRQLGARLVSGEAVEAAGFGRASAHQGRLANQMASPPLLANWRSSWPKTLRRVMTTSRRQRSSRSASCGKRPSVAPRQKLPKVLNAASSSSSMAPARRARRRWRGRDGQGAGAALPEMLRGGVAAGLEVADPAGHRAVVLDRHGIPSAMCGARPHAYCNHPGGGSDRKRREAGDFFPSHGPRPWPLRMYL